MHAHYATYPALAAWLCRRLTGTPYSFTAHAHDLYVDQSMLARKLADAAFAVTISEHNRRFLEAYGDAVADPRDPRRHRHRRRCPFRPRGVPAEGPVRALCVASLQEYKGHAVLLEALAGTELERVELDLVGDGPLRAELERPGRRAGARRPGAIPREHAARTRCAELFDRADLFVLPSVVARDGQMEGVPVVLMEALAAGVPVVATRMSGIPELVHDGETGLLAAPGDPSELREALVRVVTGGFEPDLRRRAPDGRA